MQSQAATLTRLRYNLTNYPELVALVADNRLGQAESVCRSRDACLA